MVQFAAERRRNVAVCRLSSSLNGDVDDLDKLLAEHIGWYCVTSHIRRSAIVVSLQYLSLSRYLMDEYRKTTARQSDCSIDERSGCWVVVAETVWQRSLVASLDDCCLRRLQTAPHFLVVIIWAECTSQIRPACGLRRLSVSSAVLRCILQNTSINVVYFSSTAL